MEIEELTHIDYHDDCALALKDEETDEFVAIGRYYSLSHDPKSPQHKIVEVAVVACAEVVKGYGLGTYMMYEVLQVAVQEHKTAAVATVLKENHAARRMFERFSDWIPGYTERLEDDVYEIQMPLEAVTVEGSNPHDHARLSFTYDDLIKIKSPC